jgi:hypothetical protein
MTEEYPCKVIIGVECPRPKVSGWDATGMTFHRKQEGFETDGAKDLIEYAGSKLSRCKDLCNLDCQLKRLANATPEQILGLLKSNKLQISGS